MQYRVPQNVDIEDKVIGPLSLRQFIFLLIGTAFILILYFVLIGPLRLLFWLLTLVIIGITGVFAFARYGDQPFEVFALGALKTLRTPKQRIWKREVETETPVAKADAPAKEISRPKSLTEVRGDLGHLAEIIDSGGRLNPGQDSRITTIDSTPLVVNDAPDLLNRGESENSAIDPLIERSEKTQPKREPLISEVASISPDQQFNYPSVQVSNYISTTKIK
jgi:hypothetical protein